MIDRLKLSINYRKYIKLDIALTNLCNSRCRTCNIWQYYQKNKNDLNKEVSVAQYLDFFRTNPTINQITFSGGEPFLKKDFIEIVNAAVNNIPNLSFINIVTNCVDGKLVIKQICQLLKNKKLKRLHLAMSLDGDEETHDLIRGVEGNYRSVMQVAEYIKSLKNKNISYHYSYTISKYNLGKIEKFINKGNVRAKELVLCFAQNSVRYNQPIGETDFTATNQLVKKEVATFLKYYKIDNLENFIQWLFLKIFIKDKKIKCVSGQNTFHLDPYGNFYQCGIKDGIVGNIKQGLPKRNPPKNCFCYTPCESYFGIINEFPSILYKVLF
jgi:sulfatase maturation enzyme AslB (radical SAM superfamily)